MTINYIKQTVTAFAVLAVIVSVPFVASAQTNDADYKKIIADLQAQIDSYLAQSSASSSAVTTSVPAALACPYTWNRNLAQTSTGTDVQKLQQFLNADPDTRIASSGVGSPGNETTYYGSLTAKAVSRYQEKYAASILTPVGLTKGTGFFYNSTRKHANDACSRGTVASNVKETYPNELSVNPGTSAVVRAGAQPANGFAVKAATRVAFTKFTLSASRSADLQVAGVVVRRVGLSSDDNFLSIALIGQDGRQIGSSRGLDSDSQALIGGRFVIPRGTSQTFTVVGNMTDEDNDINGGEVAALDVVDIHSNAVITGLPIQGASHTINDSLEIGSIEVRPKGSTISEEDVQLGEDSIVFFDVDLRADGGSGDEDLRLFSVSLEQTGSIDPDQIAVKFYIDNEEYTPYIRGAVYTAFIPKGLLIRDGDSVSFTVEGEVLSGSDRDVQFELYRNSDIYAIGTKYGYGASITSSDSTIASDDTPFAQGGVFAIKAGDTRVRSGRFFTSADAKVQTDSTDATLGGIEIVVEGESIEIDGINLEVEVSTLTFTANGDEEYVIDHLGLYDEKTDRRLVSFDDDVEITAQPSDDTVSIDIDDNFILREGVHNLAIKGSLNDQWVEGNTIQFKILSWDRIRGIDSRDTITSEFPTNVTLRRVTVQDAEVDVHFKAVGSKSFVEDSDSITVGQVIFDATDSDDDIRFSSINIQFAVPTGKGLALNYIDDCELHDDNDDRVSRGSEDARGTTGTEEDILSFSLDRDFVVRDGTEEVVNVVCNIDSGLLAAIGDDSVAVTLTGSGNVDYEILASPRRSAQFDFSSASQRAFTIVSTGQLFVDVDKSSTDLVAVGATGVEVDLGVITFRAENEDVTVNTINLDITAPTSATSNSIERVKLNWSGGSKTVNVSGNDSELAFEALSFTIEEGEEEEVQVSVILTGIDDDAPGDGGKQVSIRLDADATYLEASGDSSGNDSLTVATTGGSANDRVIGTVYTHRSIPSFAVSTITSDLTAGTQDLFRFSVSANSEGPISINSLKVNETVTGATVATHELYAYSNSGRTNEVSTGNDDGKAGDGTLSSGVVTVAFTEPLVIDAGETVYFTLIGAVSGTITDSSSVTYQISTASDAVQAAGVVAASVSGSLVWSPHSAGNSSVEATAADWFNGFQVLSNDRTDAKSVDRD